MNITFRPIAMFSIFTNIVLFLMCGSALAHISIQYSFSIGVIGAICLIAYALIMKRRWGTSLNPKGQDICHCEQALRIQLSAYTLLLGHLATALLHTDIDIHVGSGTTIAIDSWMMTLAAIATEFIFRRNRKITDERDAQYSAIAVVWGYRSLALLIIVFAMYLGLTPPAYRIHISNFLVGNTLIMLTLGSYCVYISVRLFAYFQDRKLTMRNEVSHE